MPPLRVAVIGAGAFGRNHLRVYRELETAHPNLVQLAALVEPDPTRRQTYADLYNIPTFPSVAALLASTNAGARPEPAEGSSHLEIGDNTSGAPGPSHLGTRVDAASICVPTIHHAAVAAELLAANLDLLIEKPFAASLAEADHILSLAAAPNRIVAIGHLERFNPAVTAVISKLNCPMFFEAHRLSIFTPRSLDVDVVLDLMIHDLDIVLSLTNSPVREVRAVGLPVLSRKTDIANVRVEFESGCVANFTASRVSTEQVRKLRLFQPHQYLSLDFARQELLSIDVDPSLAALMASTPALGLSSSAPLNLSSFAAGGGPASGITSGAPGPSHLGTRVDAPKPATTASDASKEQGAHHPTPGLNLQKLDLPRAEPLRLEIENFLEAVRTRTQPRVNATAGRAALALALQINQEIATHAHRAGLT